MLFAMFKLNNWGELTDEDFTEALTNNPDERNRLSHWGNALGFNVDYQPKDNGEPPAIQHIYDDDYYKTTA